MRTVDTEFVSGCSKDLSVVQRHQISDNGSVPRLASRVLIEFPEFGQLKVNRLSGLPPRSRDKPVFLRCIGYLETRSSSLFRSTVGW